MKSLVLLMVKEMHIKIMKCHGFLLNLYIQYKYMFFDSNQSYFLVKNLTLSLKGFFLKVHFNEYRNCICYAHLTYLVLTLISHYLKVVSLDPETQKCWKVKQILLIKTYGCS